MNKKLKNPLWIRIIKCIAIFLGVMKCIELLYFAIVFIFSLAVAGAFSKDYSFPEMTKAFHNNEKAIRDLKTYYNSIVPKGKTINIVFDTKKRLKKFDIYSYSNNEQIILYSLIADLDLDLKDANTKDKIMDSIFNSLGWNKNTIKTLKEKLDKADCIGIENGEPSVIYYRENYKEECSFIVYDKPMTDSIRRDYQGEEFHIASNKLVLKKSEYNDPEL